MKKLALLFCGIGSLMAISASAMTNTTQQPETQYQEQCVPNNCYTDTVCNQLPCALPQATNSQGNSNQYCAPVPCNTPVNCTPDTVCNPAPCNVQVPCNTPVPVRTPAPTQNTAQTTVQGCC